MIAISSDSQNCPLCGSSVFRLAWQKNDATYVRCETCSLVYQNPQPTAEQLKRLYREDYYVKSSPEVDCVGYDDYAVSNDAHLARKLFAPIGDLGPGGQRTFLDIGCATGNVLELARAHGWQAAGLEISSWAAERARAKGFVICEKPIEECGFTENAFDAITLFDVIEHLPDPVQTLRAIYRTLKPGGRLFIQTPNIDGVDVKYVHGVDSIVLQPRAHLVLFTKKTLCAALEKSGFVVHSMRFSPKFGFFATYSRRVIKQILHRYHYRLFGVSLRRYFSEPDRIDIPTFTFNDDIRAVAGKSS